MGKPHGSGFDGLRNWFRGSSQYQKSNLIRPSRRYYTYRYTRYTEYPQDHTAKKGLSWKIPRQKRHTVLSLELFGTKKYPLSRALDI